MKKITVLILILTIAITSVFAKEIKHTWTSLTTEMASILDKAYDLYVSKKDVKGSKALVNKAYFGYYEKYGIERATQAYISGKRASEIEYEFSAVKKNITNKAKNKEVKASIDFLKKNLLEDGRFLDGKGSSKSPFKSFLASFLIILREGLEAILIVAAMISYLVKNGHKDKLKWIYLGVIVALLLSILLAIILNGLIAISGENQEIIEGSTMLIAVIVLFYVSNWMIKKSHGSEFKSYIEGQLASSLTKSGLFSLAFAAFLAVFREGAETILFYQALISDSSNIISMIWIGLFSGIIVLVIVYFLFVKLSVRLPLKPFFLATSIFLYIMAISFAGTAIKEFQEADVIGVTHLNFIPTIDILGIYPTIQTIIPQLILIALAIVGVVLQIKRKKS